MKRIVMTLCTLILGGLCALPCLAQEQDNATAGPEIVGQGPFVAYAMDERYTAYGLGRGNDMDEAKANAVLSLGLDPSQVGERGAAMPACVAVAQHADGVIAGLDISDLEGTQQGVLRKCEEQFGSPCTVVTGFCSQ